MQTTVVYDGSFAGWLTAVFEVYERKFQEVQIVKESTLQHGLFGSEFLVSAEPIKAARVYRGLQKQLSENALYNVYATFLSELPNIENVLLHFVRYAFQQSPKHAEADFGNSYVLTVMQTGRQVWREKHRMEAFVRFQLLKDGLYYSGIEPVYNVLPLIVPHFRSRYADQTWFIYDISRKYGVYYDRQQDTIAETLMEWKEGTGDVPDQQALDSNEEKYRQLWKDYFKNTGIPQRKNMRLHLRHIPARYWKHLTEKQLK